MLKVWRRLNNVTYFLNNTNSIQQVGKGGIKILVFENLTGTCLMK